jgi:hypothetical protein
VSATRVEDWLNRHDSRSDRGYTIYFVNWHGRSDFRFHVYNKTDEPDPDTGVNFGELPQYAINSWGGKTSRAWFYDFSAGPEWNSAFGAWRHLVAVAAARTAYATLAEAASQIGLSSMTLSAARVPLPGIQARKVVCRPRRLEEHLPGR